MADDRDARIAQLEAENAALRERDSDLRNEVQHVRSALSEALAQQTATSEILRAIAASSRDARPVLDDVLESARGLTHSSAALVFRRDDDHLRIVATSAASDEHI